MSTIQTIWQRAHEWLDANAPGARAWLAPPASPEMIARTEEALGVSLPDDLRESLQIHNGQLPYTAPLFAGLRLLPVEEIVRDWQVDSRIAADEGRTPARSLPPGVVKPIWVSAGWVPFARDESGNAAVVDLDPGPAGFAGQIVYYFIKHPDRPRVAHNFSEFLSDRVDEWENGSEVPESDSEGFFVGFVPKRQEWRER